MVNRLRLNEKSVRETEPTKGRDYQIIDTDVRGFAACIYRSDMQDWFVAHSDGNDVPDGRSNRRQITPIWRALTKTSEGA